MSRCAKLCENYATLRDTADSYNWFVGARPPKNIKTGGSGKEEVFRIPAIQSVSFDPSTITRDRIAELVPGLSLASPDAFDNSGVLHVNGIFDHWKWRPANEDGRTLEELAAKEASVHDFHAPLERGSEDGWLGAMQFSIAQQALRTDLIAYLVALALRDDGEWRLTPFPTPARYITGGMHLDRLEV